MADKTDLIYDLLKAEREESSDFRKEVRESHRETAERLAKLEAQSEVQNQNLAEHMRRTDILEDLHLSNEAKIGVISGRVDSLEEPKKALKLIIKWIVSVGAVSTALVAIIKFFGLF